MVNGCKSADSVYFPTQVVPPFRAICSARYVKKHSFGYSVPPVGQFIYKTELLLLLFIELHQHRHQLHPMLGKLI